MANSLQQDLFASLISEIKTYTGNDPLAPWLKGIRRMKECLAPQLLKEKLPRFLQRCAQTFESDRRYRNDLRYLRVWLQLMDYVDEPKALLRTMEKNCIGMKRSLFYQAYALYYEKTKKFEEADKVYHLAVQNLAEPLDELQKSYEQFICRMERHKNKKIQRQIGGNSKRPLSVWSIPACSSDTKENHNSLCRVEDQQSSPDRELVESSCFVKPMKESNHNRGVIGKRELRNYFKQQASTQTELDEPGMPCGNDTVVVKFVDIAIGGKSEVEDACHHGLVEPTVNMKEALNAINNMFREPIENAHVGRRSRTSQLKLDQRLNSGFEVFIDDSLGTKAISPHQKEVTGPPNKQPMTIFTDDEGIGKVGGIYHEKGISQQTNVHNLEDVSVSPSSDTFVFPITNNFLSEYSAYHGVENSCRSKLHEDTVVRRFVGSTTSEEPKVENVCHHGLVEPTINLKEAMDDINNMFGKPIDFVRAKRPQKQGKAPDRRRDCGSGFSILTDDNLKTDSKQEGGEFSILCDDDLKPNSNKTCGEFLIHSDDNLKPHERVLPPRSSNKSVERELFEPTVCMKEAMDEINKMFGMPLDF